MSTPNPNSLRPNTREQAGDQVDELSRARNAFWAIVIIIGAVSVLIPVSLFMAFRSGQWQLFVIAGTALIDGIACVAAILLSRRGRPGLGIWIVLGALWVSMLAASAVIAGLGIALAINTVLLTALIVGSTLPSRQVSWAIAISVLVGFGALLLDLFGLTYRLDIPQLQTLIYVLVGVVVVASGYFVFRQFRDYTLRTKLTVAFITVTAIAVVVVSFVAITTMQSALTEQIREDFLLGADNLSSLVTSFFKEKTTQLLAATLSDTLKVQLEERNQTYSGDSDAILAEILALDEQWVAADDEDPLVLNITTPDPVVNLVAYQLNDYLEVFPDHSEIFITDRFGATVGATGRLSDYYQADEGWWQAAWNGGEGAIFISDPEYDESAGVTASLVAVPIYNEETAEIIGILRSTLILDDMEEVFSLSEIGETGHAVLFNGSAEVIFEQLEADEESSADLPLEIRQHFIETRNSTIAEDAEGHDSLFAHVPIVVTGLEGQGAEADIERALSDLGWAVVFRQEVDEAFAPINQLVQRIQLVAAGILVLVGLAALFLAEIIRRPILALATAAETIGAGDLDAPLPPVTGDEVGSLTTSLGDMVSQLKQTLSDLEMRARVIETSAGVSQSLSTILDQQDLVRAVVEEVQKAFNYYHAHIYLFDERNENLMMVGGTGEAGKIMLSRGHKIPKGKGLVGRAAEDNQIVLVPDTSSDPNWLPNPLLPETKSEIAVPITVGEQVQGVLDVQHNIEGGLDQEDVALLETVAGQVAIALQNARLYSQSQRQAEREELVNLITQKIQTATTIESVLQTAIKELKDSLGVQRAAIQIGGVQDNGDGYREIT